MSRTTNLLAQDRSLPQTQSQTKTQSPSSPCSNNELETLILTGSIKLQLQKYSTHRLSSKQREHIITLLKTSFGFTHINNHDFLCYINMHKAEKITSRLADFHRQYPYKPEITIKKLRSWLISSGRDRVILGVNEQIEKYVHAAFQQLLSEKSTFTNLRELNLEIRRVCQLFHLSCANSTQNDLQKWWDSYLIQNPDLAELHSNVLSGTLGRSMAEQAFLRPRAESKETHAKRMLLEPCLVSGVDTHPNSMNTSMDTSTTTTTTTTMDTVMNIETVVSTNTSTSMDENFPFLDFELMQKHTCVGIRMEE